MANDSLTSKVGVKQNIEEKCPTDFETLCIKHPTGIFSGEF
jgi:hypothetical protein